MKLGSAGAKTSGSGGAWLLHICDLQGDQHRGEILYSSRMSGSGILRKPLHQTQIMIQIVINPYSMSWLHLPTCRSCRIMNVFSDWLVGKLGDIHGESWWIISSGGGIYNHDTLIQHDAYRHKTFHCTVTVTITPTTINCSTKTKKIGEVRRLT